MITIELTDTIRGFLFPQDADAVLAALTVTTRDVSIEGKPPAHWHIDQKRNAMRSYLHLFAEKTDDGPLYAALVIDLPEHAIAVADIPEEHRWLTVKDGRAWTVADLSMIDEGTFYSLECLLSTAAYQRVTARLRVENPSGWRTWQRWPDRVRATA